MKTQKLLIIIISIITILSLSACSSGDADSSASETEKTTVAAVTSEAAVTDAALEKSTEDAISEKNTDDKSEDKTSAAANDKEEKTQKSTADKDTEKSKKTTKTKKKDSDEKSSEKSLTIVCGSNKNVLTESQMKSIGLSTYTYSYRNKDSAQRQFITVKGVTVKSIIDKSGFSGNTIRITCKDGYTKDYSLSDLYQNKNSFKKTYGSKADSVPAVITIGDSDSFKLCFGQRADDDDDNGDYNAQFWAKNIVSITVL